MVIFSHRYLDWDNINVKIFVFPSEHHYVTQTLKFNNFSNQDSTKLNNVFNVEVKIDTMKKQNRKKEKKKTLKGQMDGF